MFNLDQAITAWRCDLQATGLSSEAIDELESHLRDHLELRMNEGADPEGGFHSAVQALGSPTALQNEFAKSLASDTSGQVLALARREAARLGHDFIGTEHLLLGVLTLAPAAVSDLLRTSNLNPQMLRAEIERLVAPQPPRASDAIPLTPRARRALELAQREAKTLKQPGLTANHIVLGLLREGSGVAAMALKNLGFRAIP